MANSKLSNNYSEDEIDLKELLQNLINSKKIIIIFTLVSALLTFTYSSQKETLYTSTALIEIGSYDSIEYIDLNSAFEAKLVETIPELIKNLTIELIYKQQVMDKLTFKSIQDRVLEISYTSPASNSDFISSALIYIQNRHSDIMISLLDPLKNEIESVNSQISSLEATLLRQNEAAKLKVANEKKINISKIPGIDTQILTLENKINILLNEIAVNEENLASLVIGTQPESARIRTTLNQVIHGYKIRTLDHRENIEQLKNLKNQIKADINILTLQNETLDNLLLVSESGNSETVFKITQDKSSLDLQLRLPADSFAYERILELNQEILSLASQIKLMSNVSKNKTKLINDILTVKVPSNTIILTLLGAFCGFIFSIFIAIFRQSLLLEDR